MSDDLIFLFDKIDPDKGLISNLSQEPLKSSGQNTFERFLKKTFSNYNVKFRSSYFCEEESKWLYPIFINNLWFLNSVTQIESKIPKKVLEQIQEYKKGKIIIFITEPFFQSVEEFRVFENIVKYLPNNFIFCVMHKSSVSNVIFYDACILDRKVGMIYDDNPDIKYLKNHKQRKFSCFLYYYFDCSTRFLFLSFLEKTKILDQIYISAKNQAREFNKYNKQKHSIISSDLSFSSFDKTFNILNIEETLKKSLIHIAYESDIISNSDMRFISEKVYRCIEAKIPFIYVSYPHALDYFRSLGFKSFSPFINEDYDKEEDAKKRLYKIFTEIKRLSEIPFNQLKKQIQDLEPIFEHNLKTLSENHNKTQDDIFRILNDK